MSRAVVIAAAIAVGLGAAAAPAHAQAEPGGDYDPSSRAWNGLSTFTRLASGLGLEVFPVSQLEWSDLDDGDVLVLLYPLRTVDPGKVASFVNAGGHVIVADDFGASSDAMGRLGLLRAEVGAAKARRYHDGRMWAPVADVLARHPITAGVDEVVCNHPAVLSRVQGAEPLIGFTDGDAVVAAGTLGTGRFVVVSDPSILINRMMQFPGNLTLAVNMLRWLDRGGRVHRMVLLIGDVPMYGEPRPFIDDAGASSFDRKVHDLNHWLASRNDWLLTTGAMRGVGLALAALLVAGAILTLPFWRRHQADGRWLRVERPPRKDDLERAVAAADAGSDNFVVPATVLRDLAQAAIARVTGTADPLFTMSEHELVAAVTAARGQVAGTAMGRVYRRLRGLPSRSQAAAPWSGAHLSRREFDRLHDDVGDLQEALQPRDTARLGKA
ncbi:MAG: hypothetical protein H6709_24530 [Kofleriaceae bacterium]|nr:hypothetical protein [Myxococcales bacterium]MCB9564895.1 hypothetical protein [Kofleriaceae bacterium]MCB9575257.1 hypothetical protein [Kofleriaceae bacterium]